jgi:uncharacterized membrane protein
MRILKFINLLTLISLLLVTGCSQQKEEEKAEAAAPEIRQVFHVFSFDGAMGNRYMMHFNGADSPSTLFTHNETLDLEPQPAASGAKYQGDRIMVWIKGDDVLMEVDGKRVGPCAVSGLQSVLSKAWLSGADFWAVGNEPSWNLIMGRDRVILLTEMGQKSMEFEGLEKGVFDPREPYGVYKFTDDEQQELKIEILAGLCTDVMSGEPFAVSVRLVLDGEEMIGCGTGLF